MKTALDALLTLFSKGQLVIPVRLRKRLGLHAGARLKLSLEADGLHLRYPLLQSYQHLAVAPGIERSHVSGSEGSQVAGHHREAVYQPGGGDQ